MKKLIFVVALIGVLVGSTLGGMAIADSGGDPNYGSSLLSDMREMKENVSDILETVSTFEAPEFREQLAIIAGGIYDIDRQIGNITMETMSNEVEVVCDAGEAKLFTICGDSYPDVRHVFITISATELTPPAVEAEVLYVYGNVGIVPPYIHDLEMLYLDTSFPEVVSYEFNASEWEIKLWMTGNHFSPTVYNVQYAATITYPN